VSQFERPNIAKMQGYTSGEQPQDGRSIKLNTNENPYPPSPHVAAALKAFASDQLRVYPQPDARALRQAIADHHEISVDSVVITHAGDEALRLAVTTFVAPGGVVASTEPTYSLYPVLAQIQDARMFTLDLDDDWSLPNDFASKVNAAGAQLTCVVNPHAPSGYLNNIPTLQGLAEQLEGVLLVDEAYADFVDVDEPSSSKACSWSTKPTRILSTLMNLAAWPPWLANTKICWCYAPLARATVWPACDWVTSSGTRP